MGSLISAKCKCGYDRRMALGGGMRNHLTYCAFPCYCQDCKSLYVAYFRMIQAVKNVEAKMLSL